MTVENQNIEFKQSWRDEYLKQICGFANAQGGVLLVGVNDKGVVVGLPEFRKLMEELPNKVKQALGITVDVDLRQEEELYFIEMRTQPSSVPISHHGRYYYRSGSTNQELTGTDLTGFLLEKSGSSWDDAIDPRIELAHINPMSVSAYLQAAKRIGRIPDEDDGDLESLLLKLRLSVNGQFKRAAIALFGFDPSVFYPNTQLRIGKFGKDDADLEFQEILEGNLIQNVENTIAMLNFKFLIKKVEYEGMNRIEKDIYPLPALREMLLNALVHRNYMGAQVQIRVYEDKISIWNEGSLPVGMDADSLKRSHASRPRNPIIAEVCFKGGYIESWGRGTLKIIDSCREAGLPDPEIIERDGGILVTLFQDVLSKEQLIKSGLSQRQIDAVLYVKKKGRITNKEFQELFNVSRNTSSRELSALVEQGIFKSSESKGAGSYYELE